MEIDIDEDVEIDPKDRSELEWRQQSFRIRQGGFYVVMGFCLASCLLSVTILSLQSAGFFVDSYTTFYLSEGLFIYWFAFLMLVGNKAKEIFYVNHALYKKVPGAAWRKWLLFTRLQFSTGFTYTVYLFVLWTIALSK